MNFRDVELLSAYLDGQLSPSEASRLEARLSTDQTLKATLEDLRGTRTLLRRLPQRRAPRNFLITPKMAGIRPPEPRAYPAFRFATALAAFLFVAAVALNAFVPFAAARMAAPAAPVGYGMGGGGGGSGGAAESQPSISTEAPLQAPQAALAATATAEGAMTILQATAETQAEDTARAQASTEAAGKTAPVAPPAPLQSVAGQPVPWLLIIALGVLMLVCGAAAWLLKMSSDRRIRDRWNRK